MHGRIFQAMLLGPFAALLLLGCSNSTPEIAEPPLTSAKPASHFDRQNAGTIIGIVQWDGSLPEIPPLLMRTDPPVAQGKTCPNPNAPVIDPASKGVGNAIVFLRGVDPRQARPWDHRPVRVEHRDLALHVIQGDVTSKVGIVRRGDAVEIVSRDPNLHALEARGASFFSLRLVDMDKPVMRRMNDNGVVELKSATGYFWMRSHLLVDEHPYYARTDSQGRFEIRDVPPGKYRIVCWLPSWRIVGKLRDPESSLTTRMIFAQPMERAGGLEVAPAGKSDVVFNISAADFPKR